ncbi:MAG TPA: redoxin domain-containing protein [Candidatus Eisenbacteria bacterium]|jgi:thiol-disulfide isomerase/thioredoxin
METRGRARRWLGLCIAAMALIPSAAAAAKPASPVGAKAPAIASSHWINSRPLGSKDLEGKVVVVEFWTFACINCMRTIPAMRRLHALLPRDEVAIVGVHSPETDRERELVHLEDAVRSLDIDYPIAVDNDFRLWRGFQNRYWPALYVLDKHGIVRHVHVGELHERSAAWDQMLEVIGRLRKEAL